MKICRTCKKEKEITEFKKSPMYKDGHETQCKQCQKDIKLAKLENNKDLDQRWIESGKTDLQKGLMALTRSIARPEFF